MTNWNRNQPIIHHLREVLPHLFPVLRESGHGLHSSGIGGWVPRRTLSGSASFHAEGRAADIYLNANDAYELAVGNGLFNMFITHASELGVDHVIWNRQQWSIHNSNVRAYPRPGRRGASHRDHVHVGFTRQGSPLRPPALEVYAEAIDIPEHLQSSIVSRNAAHIMRCAISDCDL